VCVRVDIERGIDDRLEDVSVDALVAWRSRQDPAPDRDGPQDGNRWHIVISCKDDEGNGKTCGDGFK